MNHDRTSNQVQRLASITTMPSVPAVETPEDAGRLHAEVQAINAVLIVPRAIAIGEYLERVKSSCGHGQWLPWLTANAEVLGFKGTQARTYMRMYENREVLIAEGIRTINDAARRIQTTRKPREITQTVGTTTQPIQTPPRAFVDVVLPKPGSRSRHIIDGIAKRLNIPTEQAAAVLAEINEEWRQSSPTPTPTRRTKGVQTKFRTTKRRKQGIERAARRKGVTQNDLLNDWIDEMLRIETGGAQ